MSLRLIVWTLCMAYVAFLLAGTKGAFSPGIAITAAFLGAMIGFCLGIMFANRAHRRHREDVLGGTIARMPRRSGQPRRDSPDRKSAA
jgi:membrane associated rhomboid family serine protease